MNQRKRILNSGIVLIIFAGLLASCLWTQKDEPAQATTPIVKMDAKKKQPKVTVLGQKNRVSIMEKIIPGSGVRKLDKLPEIFERLKEPDG